MIISNYRLNEISIKFHFSLAAIISFDILKPNQPFRDFPILYYPKFEALMKLYWKFNILKKSQSWYSSSAENHVEFNPFNISDCLRHDFNIL